ncbi:hypothetical protein VTJ49DRAFT_4502 [Mycothermus thermophilus]|uniref:Hpc2-related domain-containing protein n=1 Tax=Humicola insolens TaxID=85995 RepID=A0ABR3V586_HUMIN
MDEIIVDPSSVSRFAIMQQHQQPADPPPDVPLTAAGLPRKKPGRKPGSTVKPKPPADGTPTSADQPKQRRPRKPKDPNAPPAPRKRKAAAVDATDTASDVDTRSVTGPPRPDKITELPPMRMDLDPRPSSVDVGFAPPKRDTASGSMNMQNLLNNDEPPTPQPKPAPAPTRQMFDPIRGNYDPIRESVASRDSYGTAPLGSPRAPTQVVNRASASPSIASLVDPQPTVVSPRSSYTNPRFESAAPTSPSQTIRSSAPPPPPPPPPKPATIEARRPPAPPPAPVSAPKSSESKTSSFTSMTSLPSASGAPAPSQSATAPPQSKKIAAVVQQERESNKKARSTSSASPRIGSLRDALPPLPGNERSILDFGRARPGEEQEAPSISLRIPLAHGECNKYVNFMRMAEERYGWDALHPRLAASRERKARIAAATAALERAGSGRDSGEDMDVEDILHGSDLGESNVETAPAKPQRKKRTFKEDEYDKDDDFVDDSELLWEEQAAASRDGFFVYSGPLIPEEKPPAPEERPRRGRGGRGRGSRGGAASTRNREDAAGETRTGTTSGRGRGGGPGSRGGAVRKPRITKLEKEMRDKEKAERERLLAQAAGKAESPSLLSSLGSTPALGGVTGLV